MTTDITALKVKLECVRDDVAYRIGDGDNWRLIEKSAVEELLLALSRLAAPRSSAAELLGDPPPGRSALDKKEGISR